MSRRPALRHAAMIAVALLAASSARGSDPQPYTVELAATGNGGLDQALRDCDAALRLQPKNCAKARRPAPSPW